MGLRLTGGYRRETPHPISALVLQRRMYNKFVKRKPVLINFGNLDAVWKKCQVFKGIMKNIPMNLKLWLLTDEPNLKYGICNDMATLVVTRSGGRLRAFMPARPATFLWMQKA
jgi:hypothetical protein